MCSNISFALHTGEGLFPSFDHAVGDPKEAEIHIEPHHRVVLIEGNYLLLGESLLKTLQIYACLKFSKDFFDLSTLEACPNRERCLVSASVVPLQILALVAPPAV